MGKRKSVETALALTEEPKVHFDEAHIVEIIDKFDTIHYDLHTRQDKDMDDYELVEEDWADDEYADNVTFNEPRHFGDMTVQLLEASVPHIEVNYEDGNAEKENACEQFHISLMKSADELLQAQLGGSVKGGLVFYGAVRGWMVLRVTIFRDKDGRLIPMLVPCDPRYMKWGVGRGRLIWGAYETWRDAESIYSDYQVETRAEDSRVTDFWSGRENVILVERREEKRFTHSIGYPPFIIVPVTTTPKITGEGLGGSKSHIKSWGESIFGANRGLYRQLNKLLTIWMSLVVKAHDPGGFLYTDDPGLKIDETPYGKGTVQTVPFTNTKWEAIRPADIASSTPELFGQLASAVQRGGFPWVQYGQLWRGQELSGNALEELKEGVDKILIPLLKSLGMVHQRAARMSEEQFESYDTKWVSEGYDTRGRHFFAPIKPKDIEGNHEIKYEFLAIRPQEEAANYAKANMMKTSRLAPDNFIRKDIVKFQNPQMIEDDMDIQEAAEMSPKIAMLRKVEKLEKAGRSVEAQLLFEQLQMQRMAEQAQMQQMMAGMQGAPAPGEATQGPPNEQEVRARLTAAAGGGQ